MRIGKRVLRVVLIVLGLLVLTAGFLYWQASREPEIYKPAELTEAERKQAAKKFFTDVAIHFSNLVERTEPASLRLTQKDVNRYLASLPEIEALKVGGKKETVHKRMAQIGLSQPAVAMQDGLLTLMARSTEYNKIVSLGISFSRASNGHLQVQLAETRVGELGVPQALLRDKLEQLKKEQRAWAESLVAKAGPDRTSRGGGYSMREIELVMAKLIAAIDEEPVGVEFKGSIGGKWVRIEAVDVADGEMTLQLKPLGRQHRDK